MSWYSRIPVSINCAYGDPLIKQQEVDTTEKLRTLTEDDHGAPFGFCTKGLLSDRGEDLLRSVGRHPNNTVRYSLTDLGEGNFSFDARVDTIRRLESIFGEDRIIISIRPIIPGRNDDQATLARIIDVAAAGSGVAILGGLHEEHKQKRLAADIDAFMRSYCDSVGVKYFYKSSCSSAYVTGSRCWMHELSTPVNLDALQEIGYEFDVVPDGPDGSAVRLRTATLGDLNFTRMLTRSQPTAEKVVSNYNLLSWAASANDVEMTSSWYVWARNLPMCLNCDYCIINDIGYLEQTRRDIGADPRTLPGTLRHRPPTRSMLPLSSVSEITPGSREVERSRNTDYRDHRVIKPCMRRAYADATR